MAKKEPLYPHIPKSQMINPPDVLLGDEATKFLADIKKSIPDEEMASKEYADMANVAERLGHYGIADTLRAMSRDEGKHRGFLEDMLLRL